MVITLGSFTFSLQPVVAITLAVCLMLVNIVKYYGANALSKTEAPKKDEVANTKDF